MIDLDYEKMISSWDDLIKQGRGNQVCSSITVLNYKTIPRKYKAKLAEIARRTLLEKEAIKILYPVIHNEKSQIGAATDNEKTEYAAALIEIGLTSEAERILSAIEAKACPKSLLYHSFLLFKQWDYARAKPKLKEYVRLESNEYKKIVGEINLASALVFTWDFDEATALLLNLIRKSKQLKIHLLTGSSYELLSQIQYQQNQTGKALENLELSYQFLKSSNSMALLYSEKWRFLINLKMKLKIGHNAALDMSQLSHLQNKAIELKSWETLRDLDKQIGLLVNDHQLINKVYYGTTYEEYRQVFLAELPPTTRIQNCYKIGDVTSARTLDLKTCLIDDKEFRLKPGGLLHRLLIILSSDFYRPFPVGELFSGLYPDEYYNPQSSPDRVHKVVKRFRAFFVKEQVPLKINYQSGAYSLVVDQGIQLLITRYEVIGMADKNVVYLNKISAESFNASEASHIWNVSKRTANRIIKEAIGEDRIHQIGKGPSTRFKKVG